MTQAVRAAPLRKRAWEAGLTHRLVLGTTFAALSAFVVDLASVATWLFVVLLNELALRPFVFTQLIAPAASTNPFRARLYAAGAGLFATCLWSILPSLVWMSGVTIGPPLACTLLLAIILHVVIGFQRDRILVLSPFLLTLTILPFLSYSAWHGFLLALGIVVLLYSLAGGILDRDKLMRLLASKEMSRELAVSDSLQKSQFVATMSHELRTPLNAIIGHSEMLQEDLSPAQRGDVDRIHAAAHRLSHLVNQVLDISQIDAGHTALETNPVALDGIVRRAISSLGDDPRRTGNALQTSYEHGHARAVAHGPRLTQCVHILLHNACQFTTNGNITVRTRADAKFVRIDVIDTGIGIAADRVSTLFRDFEQGEQGQTRSRDGMGLGLALAKRLITLMNGAIEVQSEPDRGSTFTLRLPRHLDGD